MNEPIHRRPRYAQPDPAPVLAAAKRNREAWLEAMRRVSHSSLTEHERETRQGIDVDNDELQE